MSSDGLNKEDLLRNECWSQGDEMRRDSGGSTNGFVYDYGVSFGTGRGNGDLRRAGRHIADTDLPIRGCLSSKDYLQR